jgi:hypothetical protein
VNGSGGPGNNGLGGLPGIAMRAGKWGIVGIFLAALGELAQFLWPDSPRIDSLTHFLTWTGVGLALLGMQAHAKRATDMIATAEADKTIADQGRENKSNDPAIQREIDRRLSK